MPKIFFFLALFACAVAGSPANAQNDAHGKHVVSGNALVRVCSSGYGDLPENHFCLVRGPVLNPVFITEKEQLPWVMLDLRATRKITALDIVNAKGKAGAGNTGLTVEISKDGSAWTQVFQAGDETPGNDWKIKLGEKSAKARYVRVSLKQSNPRIFRLNRITVYGE